MAAGAASCVIEPLGCVCVKSVKDGCIVTVQQCDPQAGASGQQPDCCSGCVCCVAVECVGGVALNSLGSSSCLWLWPAQLLARSGCMLLPFCAGCCRVKPPTGRGVTELPAHSWPCCVVGCVSCTETAMHNSAFMFMFIAFMFNKAKQLTIISTYAFRQVLNHQLAVGTS